MAGLAAADTFAAKGFRADIFEASTRAGGRVWSLDGTFPGQVAERGSARRSDPAGHGVGPSSG